MELPDYYIIPGDRGYDEVVFDKPVDISDAAINQVNALVCTAFSITAEQIDWRDEQTLWIWE